MKVVIIPATYNEKGNIERLITILEEDVFPKIKNHDMHILVADDNSPDGTAEEVRELTKKWKNLSVNCGERKGLGAAYLRAMSHAIEKMNADIVFEIDADLSHDPREIPHFIRKIEEGFDIVIGTRYSDGGSMPRNWPPHRKAFSVIGNILVRLITFRFEIHDWTGGFRGIKKAVFLNERDKLASFQGYTFQVAFLYKALLDKYTVAEVPIHFSDRTLGRSKIAPMEYIVNLLKYVILERILELKRFIKFLIVGGSGFILQITVQEIAVRSGLAGFLAYIIAFATPLADVVALSQAVAAGLGGESAIISNFMFNNFWTFQDALQIREKSPFMLRLLKFNTTSIAAVLIQSSVVWVSVKLVGTSVPLSGYSIPTRILVLVPTIVLFIVPLNYLIYNKIIWKTQNLKHGKNL